MCANSNPNRYRDANGYSNAYGNGSTKGYSKSTAASHAAASGLRPVFKDSFLRDS